MILLDYLGRSTVITRGLIKERREVNKKVGDRERERCYEEAEVRAMRSQGLWAAPRRCKWQGSGFSSPTDPFEPSDF